MKTSEKLRCWFAPLVAALLLGGAGYVSAQAHWPGANGRSGVNGEPVLSWENASAFCEWRGRPCAVAHTYTDRRTWESMFAGSGWVFDFYADFPGQLVVSQGLIPDAGDADEELAACASGLHDDDFRAFAKVMVEKGRGASIVRLGWEFNGNFMRWSGWNTAQWKSCYRRAALAIRGVARDVVLDWTINSHGTPSEICGGSSINCYPGDDVVDIIGIDNYDMAPSAHSREEFQQIAERPDGLSWLLNFAKQHRKPFSVGEWGVAPGAEHNSTGENPEFIRWMNEWFTAHAADIAYEAYFQDCTPNLVESNLWRQGCSRVNTQAGNLYRQLWGSR